MATTQGTNDLSPSFWNSKYENQTTGWDLGEVSPPIKTYIDQIEDKEIRILIPGAGNAYEAKYLIEKGFTNITVIDIAPILVKKLKKEWKGNSSINIIEGDFFKHEGSYDLIIEQTFFCAIAPSLRDKYVNKMSSLLSHDGALCGLLFNRHFEGGPPFGGNVDEYKKRFEDKLKIKTMEECYNSYPARQGSELWINLKKA